MSSNLIGKHKRQEHYESLQFKQQITQVMTYHLKTTSTLSHLLGQPLTVITGYVDLLSESTDEANTKEKLSIIKGQLDLINKYMADLRNIKEYKTINIAGVTLLDIKPTRTIKDDSISITTRKLQENKTSTMDESM